MKKIVLSPLGVNSLALATQSLSVWLNALRVVLRPTRIVHVGIGDGKGESNVWTEWPNTKALAFDAESSKTKALNAGTESEVVIDVRSQLIAETDGMVAYFLANNPSENGLIDPNLLRMVWPSLTLLHQIQRDAITLDRATADMLDLSKFPHAEPLWLIVDAFPAVRILGGGAQLLEKTSFVCVRALAEAGFQGEPTGADLAAVDSCLEARGFTRLIFLPALNPKLGHALYARKQSFDVKSHDVTETPHQLAESAQSAEALKASLHLSSENLQALQAKFDATLHERDAAHASIAELGSQVQEQAQAKERALHQLAESAQSAEALKASLHLSSENLQALHSNIDVMLLEHNDVRMSSAQLALQLQEEAQAKRQVIHQLSEASKTAEGLAAALHQSSEKLQDLQAKLDAALYERDASQASTVALDSQLQVQTKLKVDALQQFVEMRQSFDAVTAALKAKEVAHETEVLRVQRLTADNQELAHRQQLMNEELLKAAGQISFIKDLLLREQGI
jgi:hypothetical protein